MQIAITGASGLVGTQLALALREGGHAVLKLVRREAQAADEVLWHPGQPDQELAGLAGVDAVVHLAGEGVAAKRWTSAQKKVIEGSRVGVTHELVRSLGRLDPRPRTFVCANAVGIYGDRGDELLDESSSDGAGFLAGVCRAWEDAAMTAGDFGMRVVSLRIGLVLAKQGGALAKMLLPFRLGLGGRLGSGKQWMSWIALDDMVRAIVHALECEQLSGPVNLVSPGPVTNREFTAALGSALRRPTVMPMPGPVARLLFGQMADELLLGGTRVEPSALLQSGFVFEQPELAACLRTVLAN
ncbi:MAG: hypothetical protein ACI8QC_003147 [Planctomycetota bacterium]|jgi:uncharacterized protein (TIGR01777 family)